MKELEYEMFYITLNKINAKICVCVCVILLHAETAQHIYIKLGMEIAYTLD